MRFNQSLFGGTMATGARVCVWRDKRRLEDINFLIFHTRSFERRTRRRAAGGLSRE
jgi:hypothetical protein